MMSTDAVAAPIEGTIGRVEPRGDSAKTVDVQARERA